MLLILFYIYRFASPPEKVDQPIVPNSQKGGLGFFRKRNKGTQQPKDNGIDATDALASKKATNSMAPLGSSVGATITDVNCTINGPSIGDKQAAVNKMGLDFFADDFEGVTVSSTKCLSCETVTEQQETMIDLSVPITGYESMESVDNPQLFIQVSVM